MRDSILITADDFRRLKVMIRAARQIWRHGTYVNALERELRRANIIPSSEVPGDLVTMNSRVRLCDAQSGGRDLLTLVYPHTAGQYPGFVSVLSGLGTAILGTQVGDVLRARTAEGLRFFQVERILYQPEAEGDTHL